MKNAQKSNIKSVKIYCYFQHIQNYFVLYILYMDHHNSNKYFYILISFPDLDLIP